MRSVSFVVIATLVILIAASNVAASNSHSNRSPKFGLSRRQSSPAPATEQQQTDIYDQAFTDPVGAAQAAVALPYIAGQASTGDLYQYTLATTDEGQLPWNANVSYIPGASVNGSFDAGWQTLPDIQGMTLNRTLNIANTSAILPFYSSAGYNASRIKRAVLIMPGLPRDCWKYTSLVQNALAVQVANASSGVAADEVLIWGPCWMNNYDESAGAVESNELYWHRSDWQQGFQSSGPGSTALSSYEVLDYLLDTLFDTAQFPALQSAVLAGHSMGAQMVQRYAVLKQQSDYDDKVSFWVGNPGSFAWLDSDRPYSDKSCSGPDEWPYGLDGSGVPTYGRDRVRNDKDTILSIYQTRNMHYNFGLLDNGPGDTSCSAKLQGANHLERGALFVESLASVYGDFPASHTVNFMPNVSHQDYSMLSYNISLYRLFDEPPTSAASSSLLSSSSSSSSTSSLAQPSSSSSSLTSSSSSSSSSSTQRASLRSSSASVASTSQQSEESQTSSCRPAGRATSTLVLGMISLGVWGFLTV